MTNLGQNLAFNQLKTDLKPFFDELDFNFSNNMAEDFIRISLKRSLKMINVSENNSSDANE